MLHALTARDNYNAAMRRPQIVRRYATSGLRVIRAFERGGVMRASNQNLLRLTFEAEGVQFIPENGGGAGVRFEERKIT